MTPNLNDELHCPPFYFCHHITLLVFYAIFCALNIESHWKSTLRLIPSAWSSIYIQMFALETERETEIERERIQIFFLLTFCDWHHIISINCTQNIFDTIVICIDWHIPVVYRFIFLYFYIFVWTGRCSGLRILRSW